jgi:glutamate carboxypeptidase
MSTNSEFENIRAFFQSEWPSARNLLESLVRSNSHTCNRRGIEENVEIIQKAFIPLGFLPRRVASAHSDFAPHLILDNGEPAPAILMISHLDTVYTSQEQELGFPEFERPDGLLTGPGTMDIKGGTVMMWMLLRAWAEGLLGDLPPVRWILAWNASEEKLTDDFSASVCGIVPPSTSACLVFEADNRKHSGHEIVVGRKGKADWRIKVRGRGAHSGNAHREGVNAISRLAEIIRDVETLTDYDRGVTLNVGLVRGGSSVNRVPDLASADLEVRYSNIRDYEFVRGKLLKLNSAGCFSGPEGGRHCEVVVEPLCEIPAWAGDDATSRLASIWREAGSMCGYEVGTGTRGGLSDANFFSVHFPTLDGLGPRGGNAHTIEADGEGIRITEFVEPESFLSKGPVNLLALRALARSLQRSNR